MWVCVCTALVAVSVCVNFAMFVCARAIFRFFIFFVYSKICSTHTLTYANAIHRAHVRLYENSKKLLSTQFIYLHPLHFHVWYAFSRPFKHSCRVRVCARTYSRNKMLAFRIYIARLCNKWPNASWVSLCMGTVLLNRNVSLPLRSASTVMERHRTTIHCSAQRFEVGINNNNNSNKV